MAESNPLVSEKKAAIWNAHDKGWLTDAELWLCLDEESKEGTGLITQRQMQRELGEVIGYDLAFFITGFYLDYAYLRLKEGRDLSSIVGSAKRAQETALRQSRQLARTKRWIEFFSKKF